MTDKLSTLSDAELDAVTGGWFFPVVNKSFNFQQNNATQVAQNNQVAAVNVPVYSGQNNTQVIHQSNSIS